MDELRLYAVFAETVNAGSMSAAARRLKMSPSAVSQAVRALERQAGVTLLHRTTRKLTLTEAGEQCYPHCIRLLEAARTAADSLAHARAAPTGELRVAAPVGFAVHVALALAALLAQAPHLRLRLVLDDALTDLVAERIDLAIRVGRLSDSSWVARRLCELEMVLCAAPSYVNRHGMPRSPDELARHQWLASARDALEPTRKKRVQSGAKPPDSTLMVELEDAAGARELVHVEARITSNNLSALQQMCERGLGVARLGHIDAFPALASGALIRLLPEWHFSPLPVTVVTAQRNAEPAKVRLAVEALRRHFSTVPGVLSAGAPMRA